MCTCVIKRLKGHILQFLQSLFKPLPLPDSVLKTDKSAIFPPALFLEIPAVIKKQELKCDLQDAFSIQCSGSLWCHTNWVHLWKTEFTYIKYSPSIQRVCWGRESEGIESTVQDGTRLARVVIKLQRSTAGDSRVYLPMPAWRTVVIKQDPYDGLHITGW